MTTSPVEYDAAESRSLTSSPRDRHLRAVGSPEPAEDPAARATARRDALRDRHAQSLIKLMEQRQDLRGVNELADFVRDAIHWSA